MELSVEYDIIIIQIDEKNEKKIRDFRHFLPKFNVF